MKLLRVFAQPSLLIPRIVERYPSSVLAIVATLELWDINIFCRIAFRLKIRRFQPDTLGGQQFVQLFQEVDAIFTVLNRYATFAENIDPVEDDLVMVCIYALLCKFGFICGVERFSA